VPPRGLRSRQLSSGPPATVAGLFSAAQIRVARPSRNYGEVVAFYSGVLELPVLARWEGHEGFDGTVFGLPDASRQLEILSATGLVPTPTTEDQLVFYLGSAERVEAVVGRLTAAGHVARRSPNSYWQETGACCFVDPDGYWLILSPDAW
jgi:catechol 2,3-dioxygenase-like lactoylglutathione lyase family enzyme